MPGPATDAPPVRALLLSAKDAAKALGISRSMFYAQVHRGLAPRPIKVGSRSLWPVEDIEQYVTELRRGRREAV